MASSPFDSPEIATRFRSMNSLNTVSPSPVRKPSPMMFNAAPGWNRPSPVTTQRAVSASNGSNRLRSDSESLLSTNENTLTLSSREYLRRYNDVRGLEVSKNELIEELIVRYENLNKQYGKLVDNHDREREYNRGSQSREKTYAENVRRLKACLDRDPFVVVVVDGNSLMFKPELLAKGESGGRRAAMLLQNEIQNYVATILPDLGSDYRITARIYLDLKHTSERCQQARIINSKTVLEDFLRGFNSSQGLFDVVDTTRKTVAAQKLIDQLHLHLNDLHCRQIILGRSQSPEIFRLLQDYGQDEHMLSRITVLESSKPLEDPEPLPYEFTRFEDVFVDRDLELQSSGGAPNISLSPSSNGLPTPPASLPAMSRQLSEVSVQDVKDFMPARPMAQPAGVTSAKASPKNSPSYLSAVPAKPSPLGSWATLAAKPPPPAPVISPPPPAKGVAPSNPTIPRNRLGQRVDLIIKHDKAEVDRVKKMKMCNTHYLRGSCPYGDNCSHSHKPKPANADLQTLKLVARMAPCQNGSDCEDLKCIYGHICPAPEGRNGENCIFDKNCRFPDHLHKIDRTVVRTVKVS